MTIRDARNNETNNFNFEFIDNVDDIKTKKIQKMNGYPIQINFLKKFNLSSFFSFNIRLNWQPIILIFF